jgi:alkylation response protein AidB-like acyl-CoA dehydrogenase
MQVELSLEDETFKQEVRAFLAKNLTRDLSERITVGAAASRNVLSVWHKALHRQGWIAVNWPMGYGGTGWTPMQKHIFNEEMALANAPRLSPFGLSMVGPVIYTFGNDEQKARHLPGILSGEVWWCQGYSEPGSGSDLASLKTRAIRQDDHYIVNGQKIWTSYAHEADWIFCLVRTSEAASRRKASPFYLST